VSDLLLRIDDRLIHGQVTAGWVEPLGLERIVLVNDAVAADRVEREIYSAAVPAGVELVVLPVADAVTALKSLAGKRTMCLVAGAKDALRLVQQGIGVREVNVGGIHGGPGRREFLPYVFLTDEEVAVCRSIAAGGVRLEARMLPGSEAHDLAGLLERESRGGS